MSLSLQQFEAIMGKQQGHTVTLSHYGCFNHCNIYEKFKMESDQLEYMFLDLKFENEPEEFMSNTLLKQDIAEITYLDFSGQIHLILSDGNRLMIDLAKEFDIDE